jgi:iron only hydrogenase large subunit-like protein
VKAIRVVDGQAVVDDARCIACGTCVRECPQEAKSYRNDVARAALLVKRGGAAATVAPSFAAFFGPETRRRLPDALRRLGFTHVAETAVGAFEVARATAEAVAAEPGKPHVCTACPAVVSYIEQYEPDMTPHLVSVVSPMLAHAMKIRRERGPETPVVFIGPCVAKKAEIERIENTGLVDVALTFTELQEWLDQEGIDPAACAESDFDDTPGGDARFFPVPGGLAKTAALHTDLVAPETLAVSGFEEFREAVGSLRARPGAVLLEPLFCAQGCVNGPGMTAGENMFARRSELIAFAAGEPFALPTEPVDTAALKKQYGSRKPLPRPPDEAAIREVLERTGKAGPEDQLNCGACGYPTCRDNAVAVLSGMATPDMCIPHMRRRAEQRSDKIMETTPNGVVILNDRLEILVMNPAFRRMFQCGDAALGKHISYLMDPEPFEQAARAAGDVHEATVRHERYDLICHQLVYALPGENQYAGILVNITNSHATQEKLKSLRSETLRKAHELMEHQVRAAQEMAQYLGESTARSEELLRNIQSMAADKPREGGDHWLWDTDTTT